MARHTTAARAAGTGTAGATGAGASAQRARFQSPFPPLELSIEDEVQLENVAHMFVRNTIAKFEAHEHHGRRVVDLSRWKLVRRKHGMCLYVERCGADSARRRRREQEQVSNSQLHQPVHDQYAETVASSSQYMQERESTATTGSPASADSMYSRHLNPPNGAPSKSIARPDLPVLLAIGTMEGALEDAMYGIVTPTVDAIRIRSSFVLDDLTDAAVLASLVTPTPREPFRTLSVKWIEKRVQSKVLSLERLANARDSVVLELTGMTQLASGENVGFFLLHSVHFPQTQPLPSTIRNNMSICCIVRQHSSTSVEFFLKGYMNLPRASTLMRAIAIKVAARSVMSVRKYVEWGRMKKLVFALEQLHRCPVERIQDNDDFDDDDVFNGSVKNIVNETTSNSSRVSFCTICKKRARRRHRIFQRRPTPQPKCKLCLRYVCASCLIKKQLRYITVDGQLQHNEVTLCALCIHGAMIEANTLGVASEEVALSMELSPLPMSGMKAIVGASSMKFSDLSLLGHASPW